MDDYKVSLRNCVLSGVMNVVNNWKVFVTIYNNDKASGPLSEFYLGADGFNYNDLT